MENKFKGAVFFDYDGTLTYKNTGLFLPSAETVVAIKSLRQNGYAACLSTGRSYSYVPDCGIEFDIMLTDNGGCTVYNDKILGEKPFDKKTIKLLMDYFTEHNMIYVLESSHICFVNLPDDTLFNKMIALFNVSPESFTPVEKYNGENIYKLMLIYRNPSDFEPFKNKFSDIADITMPSGDVTSCDINPKGVSKADGVFDVCKYFNIDIKDTYAIGDGENDYTMLKAAGHGIAMKVHHQSLDSVAEYITGPADGDGIRQALLHYGLID